MSNNCGNITNPISTNSIIEVGIDKPVCAPFTGNSLNDWLLWLGEQQCAVDWSALDLTKIKTCLGEGTICNQDQKSVIETIVDYLNKLAINCELPTNKKGSLEVTKLVTNLTKNITGTYNVKFLISLKNTGNVVITNLNVTDNLQGLSGCAFVGVTVAPLILVSTTIPTLNLPTINSSFNGGSVTGIFIGDGQISPGEILHFTFEVEINENCLIPQAPPLLNIATANGVYLEGSNLVPVNALSNPVVMVPKVISDVIGGGLDPIVVSGTGCAIVTPTVTGYNVDVACPTPAPVYTAGDGITLTPTVGGFEIASTVTTNCTPVTGASLLTDPNLFTVNGTPLGWSEIVPVQVNKQCNLVQLSGTISINITDSTTFTITIPNPLYRPYISKSFVIRTIRTVAQAGYHTDTYLVFDSNGVGRLANETGAQAINHNGNVGGDVQIVLDGIMYFTIL